MKKATIIIDYQNDFVAGALGFPAAMALEGGLRELADDTIAAGEALFFTMDTHGEAYLSTREGQFLPVEHCLSGQDGWHLYGALRAFESDIRVSLVEKPGFGSADLAGVVQKRCAGAPDVITLAGVVTNICVLSNAVLLQTAFPRAKIVVKKDLCAAPGDAHQNALALMAGLGIVLE